MKATNLKSLEKNYLSVKFSKNSTKLPLKTCKELMFFLNISYNEVEKILDFAEALKKEKELSLNNLDCYKSLTKKELEVFKLVSQGKTTKQVASDLNIQTSTVSTHRKRIKEKMNFENYYDWIAFANQL